MACLRADAALGYDAHVLDLATGPGRLALALALSLRQVVAVDVEIEMLEEGKRVADRKGIANVEWVHSRAEDLTEPSAGEREGPAPRKKVAPGSLDLVTIGEAFHRLDQEIVLRHIRRWLKVGACVAIVGCFGILDGGYAWQESLRRAVSGWTKGRPGVVPGPPRGRVHDARRLVEAGFVDVTNRDFVESQTWTRESILGHLHSTSRFSLAALGDERDDFDRVVLAVLDADGSDRFPQEVSCGYTIGWRRT